MESENDRVVVLFGTDRVELNRQNSSLYTYVGELSMYDHVFVDNQEDRPNFAYLFKVIMDQTNPGMFSMVSGFMISQKHPLYLNMDHVSNFDKNVFDRVVGLYLHENYSDLGKFLSTGVLPKKKSGGG